jgi:hypothetical protein
VVVAAFGVVGNVTFIRLKVLPQSAKKLKKKHSTLNDTVLTNSYRLGFFYLGFVNFQFDPYSSNFIIFYL